MLRVGIVAVAGCKGFDSLQLAYFVLHCGSLDISPLELSFADAVIGWDGWEALK